MAEVVEKIQLRTRQGSLSGLCLVENALETWAAAGIEERGAIFTRREVVEFILDLVGYTVERPLYEQTLLEPSFGEGDFLLVVVERLIASWRAHFRGNDVRTLAPCVRAIDLHRGSFAETRTKLLFFLRRQSLSQTEAEMLADSWLIQGDFLLTNFDSPFDFVIGNPPYVRQELVPSALIAEYRVRYSTIFDRADLYIPFIEHSLELLRNGGTLGFICADRWMKNRYGGPLRKLVADAYRLKIFVDMVETPAFHSNVIAYPAITIITREKNGSTRIAHRPEISKPVLSSLAENLLAPHFSENDGAIKELKDIATNDQPWILESSDQLALVRRLERDFPLIEEAGCKVGIGVATGADKAFIAPLDQIDVEPDRKLPIVMTGDIKSGIVNWRGLGVINPFRNDKGLVDLEDYPKLKAYLEDRRGQIDKRHIARKSPANWYRTIDRIYPAVAKKPKLLIPDIKGEAHIVYEDGRLYPHHNLYYITSDEWDLLALQAVLLSGIARLFVSIYSTHMRGGYLRFQAQYLRRIRLPNMANVSTRTLTELIAAAKSRDTDACNDAVFNLYGMTTAEQIALGGNG